MRYCIADGSAYRRTKHRNRAAALEYNLSRCYLDAAFSLKQGAGEGLSDDELKAVGRWNKLINEVARKEMAHRVVVNNLIASIGGRAQFNRPNVPVAARYHPAVALNNNARARFQSRR